MNEKWYAVITLPRWEKKISAVLSEKGITNYCPLNKLHKQWKDRRKIVYEPLFKGYVFVKISENQRWSLKEVHGIVNFVYWLGKPAVIREDEIVVIKSFLNEFNNVEVSDNNINTDDEVVIKQGVFMNYKGMVLQILGNKAKVSINSMGVQLTAIFDASNLELV